MKIVLYKFCSMESKRHLGYVRNIIVDRDLYFSDPSTFNDPYDCSIGLHLRSNMEPCGVLCFSTSECDMILMFSHYADRHRGVCLHFEIDDDDTLDEISPINGRNVEYQEKIPKFDNANRAHMALLTKYKKWEYEKEYRVFKILESNGDRIMKYKLGLLKGAIFGLHMKDDDSLLVRHWFELGKHKNAFFKQAKLSKDGFAISLIDAQNKDEHPTIAKTAGRENGGIFSFFTVIIKRIIRIARERFPGRSRRKFAKTDA